MLHCTIEPSTFPLRCTSLNYLALPASVLPSILLHVHKHPLTRLCSVWGLSRKYESIYLMYHVVRRNQTVVTERCLSHIWCPLFPGFLWKTCLAKGKYCLTWKLMKVGDGKASDHQNTVSLGPVSLTRNILFLLWRLNDVMCVASVLYLWITNYQLFL